MNLLRELTQSWLLCRDELIGSALTTGPDRDREALPCLRAWPGGVRSATPHATTGSHHSSENSLRPGRGSWTASRRRRSSSSTTTASPLSPIRASASPRSPRGTWSEGHPRQQPALPLSNDASQEGAGHEEEEDARCRQGAQGGLN